MANHNLGISAKLFDERQKSGLEPHWTVIYGEELFVEILGDEDDSEYSFVSVVMYFITEGAFLVRVDCPVQEKFHRPFGEIDDGGVYLVLVPISDCGNVLSKAEFLEARRLSSKVA